MSMWHRLPFWSPPGEISAHGCWVLVDVPWLYCHDTFVGLLWQILTEWRQDRHLVG